MTEQEFIEKVEQNKNIIHYVCNTYCVAYSRDDLVQDILLRTWLSIKNFKGNCKFSTWLYNISKNVCIDKLRKEENNIKFEGLESYADVIAETTNTHELLKQLRQAIRYNTVIDSIEKPYQELFKMYVAGLSYADLSRQSGIDENHIRVKIHRIKKKLFLRYGNGNIK